MIPLSRRQRRDDIGLRTSIHLFRAGFVTWGPEEESWAPDRTGEGVGERGRERAQRIDLRDLL